VPEKHIFITGNPVIDALHWVSRQPPPPETIAILRQMGFADGLGDRQPDASSQKLILVTAHRRENFGRPLQNICCALRDLANRYDGRVRILYPVHLNPNVWNPVHRLLGDVPNVTLTPPLDYFPLVHLMKRATLVLTDSGGIQEEAPGLGVPVLVLREVTERPEAVEAGTVRVVGTDRDRIVAEASRLLDDPGEHQRMARAVNPYGDGRASQRIVAALLGEPVEPFEPGN
jgi:UDP-N-acetylglucosamine 2-epimerase (non-hydrolysing)